MISWSRGRGLAPGLSLAVPKGVNGVTDPKADLPLSSESRQNQSLAGVRHSALPDQGAQGGLWGWRVRFLSVTLQLRDSCPNLVAWPNQETRSPWDEVGAQRRLEAHLDRGW